MTGLIYLQGPCKGHVWIRNKCQHIGVHEEKRKNRPSGTREYEYGLPSVVSSCRLHEIVGNKRGKHLESSVLIALISSSDNPLPKTTQPHTVLSGKTKRSLIANYALVLQNKSSHYNGIRFHNTI
jgi:hypothetical protein